MYVIISINQSIHQSNWESGGRTRRKRITYEVTLIRLLGKSRESCTGARRTETCVARTHGIAHVDASHHDDLSSHFSALWFSSFCSLRFVLFVVRAIDRYFLPFTYLISFLSYKQRRGGGGAAAELRLFVLLSLFSRPRERDWPCKLCVPAWRFN